MKMHRFTYFLVVLVLATLGFSLARRAEPFVAAYVGSQGDPKADRFEDAKRNFPTADYNEGDSLDPQKNAEMKEKQKRHNNFKFVPVHPQPWQTESVFVAEGLFEFPALPVAQSDFILLGTVEAANAHLSENKMNIFSEFTVVVGTAFKTARKEITEGSVLTVERIGGFVKYPNGQKILFRISGANMPKIGAQYLFFLNSKNKQDCSIITAYELTEKGALPLDESAQFEALRGTAEADILKHLRDLLSKASSN